MAIGMTYEQYWYGDPIMVRAFLKADRLRQERANEAAWLTGLYTYRALAVIASNVFSGKNAGTKETYPERPLALGKEADRQKEKTEEQEEQEAAFARAYMIQMMQAGKNWGKKGGGERA